MQSVTIDQLDHYFNELLKKVPIERRALFQEISEDLLADVQRRIGGAGKVQSWQAKYTGSGGSWAAVRPKEKTYWASGPNGTPFAVGAVTNAIESGHNTPNGKKFVPGKKFYADAQAGAEAIVRRAMGRFERSIEEAIK